MEQNQNQQPVYPGDYEPTPKGDTTRILVGVFMLVLLALLGRSHPGEHNNLNLPEDQRPDMSDIGTIS